MVESIQEFIDGLMQNPTVIAILSTLLSFLVTNIGTIILFAIKVISMKKAELKRQLENDQVIQALEAKYNGKLIELESHIDENMAKIEQHVVTKVQELETQREELINSETVTIEKALEEAKAALRKE